MSDKIDPRKRELIRIYLTMLLHEAQKTKRKKVKQPRLTDEVIFTGADGKRVDIAEGIGNMTPVEKAKIRRALRNSLKPELYKRVQ